MKAGTGGVDGTTNQAGWRCLACGVGGFFRFPPALDVYDFLALLQAEHREAAPACNERDAELRAWGPSALGVPSIDDAGRSA